MNSFNYQGTKKSLISEVALLALVSLMPLTSFAQDQGSPPAATSPDNSAQNKAQGTTSDQQKENTADRMTTKKVRQALIADKSLSTYAHNVKIVTQNGVVTLKGPVGSRGRKARGCFQGGRRGWQSGQSEQSADG